MADCRPPPNAQTAAVARVIDGDTFRLEDGRHLRLIGIDTPEVGRNGLADEPYAHVARAALRRLIRAAGGRVLLRPGADPMDRYHRLLAHAYTPEGENLTAALLRRGLGYQAVMAPNLSHLQCYREAENQARGKARGLWRGKVTDAAALTAEDTGFHLTRGRVERVGRSRHGVWLNLTGVVAVKVPWRVWRRLGDADPEDYVNRRLEVRGWFYRYRGALNLTVSHPAAIRWL